MRNNKLNKKQFITMTTIILFILLWVSPIPEWLKFLLTTLLIFEGLCSITVVNNTSNEVKTKKKGKKE